MSAIVSVLLFSIFLFVVSMLTAGVSASNIGIKPRFRDVETSQIKNLEICHKHRLVNIARLTARPRSRLMYGKSA